LLGIKKHINNTLYLKKEKKKKIDLPAAAN
jgi:hypothetical protein